MPERAHFRESLPGGRLAVPRAKNMVFPNVKTDLSSAPERDMVSGKGRWVTCLHPHEDTPGAVGASIDQAGKKAAHQQWDICVVDADILCQVAAYSSAWSRLLLAQKGSRLGRGTVHGGSEME